MNTHLVIILLALAGIVESLYLRYERNRRRPPVCVIGHSCAEVWKSSYSKTFGVSNEIWGIMFYLTIAIIEWLIFSGSKFTMLTLSELIALVVGAVMSSYFIYLQWRVIKAWCFWCTLSAVLVLLMVATRLAM